MGLLAGIPRSEKPDDREAFLAIDLLRRRHRQRPDVRAKLADLCDRKLSRASR